MQKIITYIKKLWLGWENVGVCDNVNTQNNVQNIRERTNNFHTKQ